MAKDGKKIIIRRIKKGGHGGHHGGAWKVAYADFVTAMMAFFLVMWILGMDQSLKKAIEGYFSNPVGYKKGYSAGRSPISAGSSPGTVATTPLRLVSRLYQEQQFRLVEQRLRQRLSEGATDNPDSASTEPDTSSMPDSVEHSDSSEITGLDRLRGMEGLGGAKIEIVLTSAGLRIELVEGTSGETFFPSGSADMKPPAMLALKLIGAELKELSNPVVIEGHTDAATYSARANYTNWELSADRANAARRVLEGSGLNADRVVEVRGLADRHLRLPDMPRAPENRRISLLLPFNRVEVPDGPMDLPEPAERDGQGRDMSADSPGGATGVPDASPSVRPPLPRPQPAAPTSLSRAQASD